MIVLWRIAEQCNLGCRFCRYSRERDLGRPRRAASAGEIRRVARLLGELRRATGERVLLSWLGGEPFLRRDLAALTGFAALECGLAVSATTNGTALGSPAIRRHILSCYAELTVSVDGQGGFHDRIRRWPGGFARLERSVRALAAERARAGQGPLLRTNTVLMRDNVRAFPALAEALAGWGVDEVCFNQLGGADRPVFHRLHHLTGGDADWLAHALPAVRAALAARGVRLLGGADYLARIRATAAGEPIAVAECRPGENFLFIDERGRVGPCSFTSANYGVPIEKIRCLAELRALPDRFRAARDQGRSSACGDCHSTQTFAKFAPSAA